MLFMVLMCTTCTPQYHLSSYTSVMLNDKQVDSMCKAEKIPHITKEDTWVKLSYIGDGNQIVNQYMYLKRITTDKQITNIKYVVLDCDSINKVTKTVINNN